MKSSLTIGAVALVAGAVLGYLGGRTTTTVAVDDDGAAEVPRKGGARIYWIGGVFAPDLFFRSTI